MVSTPVLRLAAPWLELGLGLGLGVAAAQDSAGGGGGGGGGGDDVADADGLDLNLPVDPTLQHGEFLNLPQYSLANVGHLPSWSFT